MTDREAISVLECMAIDMIGALSGISEGDSVADTIEQRLETIDFCQDILRARADTEKKSR